MKSATGAEPGRPLLTNHSGGACKGENPCRSDVYNQKLQKETWLDFVLFQSGQASEAANATQQLQMVVERARERPQNLKDNVATPVKPNVNGEGIYDVANGLYNADLALQVGYRSMLSSAFGYTVGVGGIWDWTNPVASGVLNSASSVRMQYLGNLFRSLPWQRLNADPGRILNQPTDPCPYPPPDLCYNNSGLCSCVNHHLMKGFATDSSGQFAIAYQPAGSTSVQFSTTGLSNFGSFQFFWFDTRLGCVRSASAVCAANDCTFLSPDSTKDWLLVMKLASVGSGFPGACP